MVPWCRDPVVISVLQPRIWLTVFLWSRGPVVPSSVCTGVPDLVSRGFVVPWSRRVCTCASNLVDCGPVVPDIVGPELEDPELVDPELVDPVLVDPEFVDPEFIDPQLVDPEPQISRNFSASSRG